MKIKKKNIRLDWYQDGNFSGNNPEDASIEQFVVTFDKPINPKKGTLKIIVPDKTKNDPYGKDKLGEIQVKMDGTSKEKALENLKKKVKRKGKEELVLVGDPVTCMIKPDDPIKSDKRFILELTQDWDCILNTEKTGIHYYDDRVKGLRLIGEDLEDENGNIIEDSKGSRKIVADRIKKRYY